MGSLIDNRYLAKRPEVRTGMPITPVFGSVELSADLPIDRSDRWTPRRKSFNRVRDVIAIEPIKIKKVRPPIVQLTVIDTRVMGQVEEPPLVIGIGGEGEGGVKLRRSAKVAAIGKVSLAVIVEGAKVITIEFSG